MPRGSVRSSPDIKRGENKLRKKKQTETIQPHLDGNKWKVNGKHQLDGKLNKWINKEQGLLEINPVKKV